MCVCESKPACKMTLPFVPFLHNSGMFSRRLQRRAPAGAGSYPIHLPSDFIDVKAGAIFGISIRLRLLLKFLVLRSENESTEWTVVFQFVSIRRKHISGVRASVFPSILSVIWLTNWLTAELRHNWPRSLDHSPCEANKSVKQWKIPSLPIERQGSVPCLQTPTTGTNPEPSEFTSPQSFQILRSKLLCFRAFLVPRHPLRN